MYDEEMKILASIARFDKETEFLLDEYDITDQLSEKELKLLLNERLDLIGCYPLNESQLRYLNKKLGYHYDLSYDYFLEFCGDWELDLKDCIWRPAPASNFTDKSRIPYQQAEDAFNSGDPVRIKDALIRTVFFDSNPERIQNKCLMYLNSNNAELQREAIVGLGHLARMHGKLDKDIVLSKLEVLQKTSTFQEELESTIDDVNMFLEVRRK